MPDPTKTSPRDLVVAAEALAQELSRFQEHVDAACRHDLISRRDLEKASQALQGMAGSGEAIGALMVALGRALEQMSAQQQVQLDRAQARAEEIRSRNAALQELLRRYELLGTAATELAAAVAEIAAAKPDRDSGSIDAATRAHLDGLFERMGHTADEVRDLAAHAKAIDFADVSREINSLRQHLLEARNKVGLLLKAVN